jgi:MSHA biogenesis protein MshE
VVAQRLLRVNCESCSKPRPPDPQGLEWLRSVGVDPGAGRLLAGSGCNHCNGSGFAGRTGIYEMLEMDSELAALANSDDPGRFMAAAEKRMAGHLLRDSAAKLALTWKTTVSEAMRVTAQAED